MDYKNKTKVRHRDWKVRDETEDILYRENKLMSCLLYSNISSWQYMSVNIDNTIFSLHALVSQTKEKTLFNAFRQNKIIK